MVDDNVEWYEGGGGDVFRRYPHKKYEKKSRK